MSEFTTKDAKLCAFLSHLGIVHLRTDHVGRVLIFTLADEFNDAEKIATDYYAGAGSTDCQRLLDCYRTVWDTIRVAKCDGIWKNNEI